MRNPKTGQRLKADLDSLALHRALYRNSLEYTRITAGLSSDSHHRMDTDIVQDADVYRFSYQELINVLR